MKLLKIFVLMLFILLPAFADETKILPSEKGVVKSFEYVDLNDENVSQTKQLVQVQILSGEFKGETIELENVLSGNPYYDITLKKNTKVVLHAEDNGDGVEFSIEDVKRSGNLIWLSLIFCGLLIYVGRKKGFFSLVSIGLTILLITHIESPLILWGVNPIVATILVCALSTALTMYLVGGFNAKSTSALIGAMLSLMFAGILSFITMFSAHLSGFTGENTMFLYTAHPELNFVHLAIAGMLLATLGAVMDVAMSIASTINEIHGVDKSKKVSELFQCGMNVGRDIIGTMANTLILVYLGSSLPLLLLAENIDLQKFINLNQVVTEIASALIGSIAIVICVPFTAIVASQLLMWYDKRELEERK